MMSKKLLVGLMLMFTYVLALAQGATVIRGETSAGVYTNVGVDAFGRLSSYTQGFAAAGTSALTSAPVKQGFRARTSNYTALGNDQIADGISTVVGSQIIKPFSIPEADWSYAAVSGGIVNTSDTVIVAAGAAGIRNYVTSCSIQNASATVATEFVLKDGATVIWRGYVGTSALLNSAVGVSFASPLKGTAATAINAAAITTSAQVYINCQGYQAP